MGQGSQRNMQQTYVGITVAYVHYQCKGNNDVAAQTEPNSSDGRLITRRIRAILTLQRQWALTLILFNESRLPNRYPVQMEQLFDVLFF